MSVPAAAAGVHGAHQHEAAGQRQGAGGPGDGHLSVLQWLAQGLQRGFIELRQLVQKQNAVVGQGDLSGTGNASAAGQRHRRGGVVGTAEGPGVHQRISGVGHARHGINFGGLQRLFTGHIRQNGGQAAGQHGLARAGRADQQYIVAAGGGDLQRALHVLLSHHVGKVRHRAAGRGRLPAGRRNHGRLPFQVGRQLLYVLHTVDGQAVGQRGLGGIGGGNVQLPHSLPGGKHGHGQHAGNGPQGAGQAQLAQKGGVLRQGPHLSRGGHDPQQDGQVIDGALLPQPGRRQIYGDAADGKLRPAVFHGGTDPFPGLLHRRVRQTHHVKGRQTAGEHTLHRYLIAADAAEPQRTHRGHHALHPFLRKILFSLYFTIQTRKRTVVFGK